MALSEVGPASVVRAVGRIGFALGSHADQSPGIHAWKNRSCLQFMLLDG